MKRVMTVVAVAMACMLTACGVGSSASQPAIPSPQTCSPAKPAKTGLTPETITVDGEQRSYELSIPPAYNGSEPLPVVFAFHGRGSNASQQLLLTGMDDVGDTNGFIVVAPSAIDGHWQFPLVPRQTTADTEFLEQLSQRLANQLCIDETRQYASGMSLGSAMTFVLACAPNRRFAAFGGVGAAFYRAQCNQSNPAPIIYFHGTSDPVVPFDGGRVQGSPASGPTSRVDAATEVMSKWAQHNGCRGEPSQEEISDTTLIEWSSCSDNADVDFYRINGGGHTWPGASETLALFLEPQLGTTTQSVAASELMWEFFENYQLPTN